MMRPISRVHKRQLGLIAVLISRRSLSTRMGRTSPVGGWRSAEQGCCRCTSVDTPCRISQHTGMVPRRTGRGTPGASARPEVFEQVATVLDDLGVRGVFLTSNAAVTERVRAAGVDQRHGVWPFVPLAPLLRHARGVVQPGAHGTNALTLEAGLPSVMVPCMFDQQWHARRQEALGTGVWVRRERDLARAIRQLLTDSALTDRARDLGAKISTEDGVGTACEEIEAILQSDCVPAGKQHSTAGLTNGTFVTGRGAADWPG
jgi:hypothetical protein